MKFLLLIGSLSAPASQAMFWSKIFLVGVCFVIAVYFTFLIHQANLILRELDLGTMHPKKVAVLILLPLVTSLVFAIFLLVSLL